MLKLNDFNGSKKGQYFSFDAIIASVIFLLTLIMLLSYWHSVRTYLDYQANDLSREATRLSTILFTPPTGTDCKNLKRLGFVNSWSDKRLNGTLLDCVKGMNTGALKTKLGASYNVSILIDDTHTTSKKDYILGTDPDNLPSDLKEISKFRRVGTLSTKSGEDHIATIDLYVYR